MHILSNAAFLWSHSRLGAVRYALHNLADAAVFTACVLAIPIVVFFGG